MEVNLPIDNSSNANPSNPIPATIPVPDEKAIKLEFKKKAFDREFRALIKQAQETIQARHGTTIELGEVRPELICLNRYLSIYNNMDPQEHYCYFENIFNRHRSLVLNCLKDDRWIRTGRLVIQFGEGIKSSKEIEEKRKQVRIMLSDIFLIACELQSNAEKTLDGIDEKFAQDAGGKDLIRPNVLLLHLIRIFYHLTDGDDKTRLGEIVTQLENDLGVAKKTVGGEPWKAPELPANAATTTGGLSGLFTMATSMMQRMGFQPPPGMKPPTEGEISNVINTVFNNETTQNAIQGMFTSLQGCNDFGTAVQQVVKNVTDPKTMGAIQESVMQTAQMTGVAMSLPPTSAEQSTADVPSIQQ